MHDTREFNLPEHLKSTTRWATLEDVEYLSTRLRDDDENDIKHISGNTPYESLLHGFETSLVCVTFIRSPEDTQAIGIGGVLEDGIIWSLFTKEFFSQKNDKRTFIKACKPTLKWFLSLQPYTTMRNITLSENTTILRWLKWLGAEVKDSTNPKFMYFQFQQPQQGELMNV